MRGLKIPVVDMSSPHARLVQEWGSAFRTFGFCKIVNHGMKSNLLEDAARRFFMQSLEEKMTAASPFYGENGYSKVGVESVGQKEPDPVESLVFNKGKARCSAVTVADELAWRYYGDCEELTRLLMRITAESMGWPSSFFDKAYERPSCALRLARYDSKKDSSKKEFLYAEHTDYTGFTLLKADPVAGLEVLHGARGEWVCVDDDDCSGALVVNSGDLLEFWTDGQFRSTLHRVRNLGQDQRQSIVFFSGPSDETRVVSEKFGTVLAGEHLARRLAASNVK